MATAFPVGIDDLNQFVDALFCYADPESYISLRAFDQVDASQPPILIDAVQVSEGNQTIVARAARASTRAANQARPGVFAPPIATFKTRDSAAAHNIANGVAISVEIDTGDTSAARKQLEHLLGPVTIALHSGSEWRDPSTGEIHPKMHLHWRLSEPARTKEGIDQLIRARRAASLLVGADKSAIPPCHPLRWPGSWNLKNAPRIAKICAGNMASEVHLEDILEKLEEAVEKLGLKLEKSAPVSSETPEARIELVRSALEFIQNDDLPWDDWVKWGMTIWRSTAGSTDGLMAWADWSAKSSKHNEDACSIRWQHFATSPPTRIGAGTLFYEAMRNGWRAYEAPEPISLDDIQFAPYEEIQVVSSVPTKEKKATIWKIDQSWLETDIPNRPWIVKGFLLRGSVTVISGPGSAGKSSLMVAWATSLASGKDYGRFQPDRPFKVLSYNVEDDRDEQRRRISATCRQFGSSVSEIIPNMLMVGPTEMGTLLSLSPSGSLLVNTPVMDDLEALIAEWVPDVVMLDPFVELHSSEENDNTAIRQVLARFRSWAIMRNVALVVLHHSRKGVQSPGDPDTMRGASAIVGAARVALTVNSMTEDEATEMNIPVEHRRDYFRLDGAKMNYSKVQDADWFERVEYQLDNDEGVAAAVPWSRPKQIVNLGHVQSAIVLIEKGTQDGPYSPKLSRDYRSIKNAFESIGVTLPDAQKELLDMVRKTPGVLISEFKDKETRNKRIGIRTENGPLAQWID
jgi:hypothetical protein